MEEISLLVDPIWQDTTEEWCGEFFSDNKPTAADFKSTPAVSLSTADIVLQLNFEESAPELEKLRILKDIPIIASPFPPTTSTFSKKLA